MWVREAWGIGYMRSREQDRHDHTPDRQLHPIPPSASLFAVVAAHRCVCSVGHWIDVVILDGEPHIIWDFPQQNVLRVYVCVCECESVRFSQRIRCLMLLSSIGCAEEKLRRVEFRRPQPKCWLLHCKSTAGTETVNSRHPPLIAWPPHLQCPDCTSLNLSNFPVCPRPPFSHCSFQHTVVFCPQVFLFLLVF